MSDKVQFMKFGLAPVPEFTGSPELKTALKQAGVGEVWKEVEPAYRFAQKAHATQKRDDGTPYYHHCARVMRNLVEMGETDPSVLKAALLHDTLEDSNISQAELAARFGKRTAELVGLLTKPPLQNGESYDERNVRYLDGLKHDPGAVAIKVADRLDNLEDVHLVPDRGFIRRYLPDSRDHYVELAREKHPASAARMEDLITRVESWLAAT